MKLGLGGVAIVVVIGLLLGKNPMEMLGLIAEVQQQAPAGSTLPGGTPTAPVDDEASQFVASILGETEDVWSGIFQASGQQYPPAQLVLFSGSVQSACGGATAAVGPFYCPGDRKVYIDLSFFQQMRDRLGGGGDFAEAYVIAHEIGHHVQNILGIERQVRSAMQSDPGQRNELSVRLELQADCLAGVWGHSAAQRDRLDPGDVEEGLGAAAAIGDDRIQRMSTGRVQPESFTHGSSEQRVQWFRRGLESGNYQSCNTF